MKDFSVKVDFVKGKMTQKDIELMQNDYNTTTLYFEFVQDVSESTVTIGFMKPNGTSVLDNIVIDNANEGHYNLDTLINQEGTYQFAVALFTGTGRLTNTVYGKMKAREELIDFEEIASDDDRVPILTNLINQTTELNATVTSAEEGRVSAENTRVSSETARANAETLRDTAEDDRVNAETSRASAEETRQSNEGTRQSNEGTRQSNETARVTAEGTRANNETTRTNNESTRQSNEQTRTENETTRQNNETSRGNAESSRAGAETSRAGAETSRVNAESSRVNAETSRTNAEASRVSAENSRVTTEGNRATAETNRVSAESSRVSAETSRVTAEQGRVTAEATRESNEAGRIARETTERKTSDIKYSNSLKGNIPKCKLAQIYSAESYLQDVELYGECTQRTGTLYTYTADGTETGAYYITIDTVNYKFTMPSIVVGDKIIFDTYSNKLWLNTVDTGTQISTTIGAVTTQTDLTTSLVSETYPNPNFAQVIGVKTGEQNVTSCRKNLLNINTDEPLIDYNGNSPSNAQVYIQDEKFYTRRTGYGYSSYGLPIKVKPNTQYTFKTIIDERGTYQGNIANVRLDVFRYGVRTSLAWNTFSITGEASITFTTPENCTEVVCTFNNIGITSSWTETPSIFSHIMVYEGTDTTQPYEPYIASTKTLNLGSIELCSINDSTDRIYKDNGNWYLDKKINKYVVRGNETWFVHSILTTTFVASMWLGAFPSNDNIPLCNYYFGTSFNDRYNNTIQLGGASNVNRLFIRDDNYTNYNLFKQHLQDLYANNTPVEVYYELNTPVTTQITDTTLIQALEDIQTYTGITNITSDIDLSAVYNKDINKVIEDLQASVLALGQ